MSFVEISIRAREQSKIYSTYIDLRTMSLLGKGNDTLMFAYPNAPFHYETASDIIMVIDGKPEKYKYQKKVHDYPIKTVNEWIEIYQKQGYFVK